MDSRVHADSLGVKLFSHFISLVLLDEFRSAQSRKKMKKLYCTVFTNYQLYEQKLRIKQFAEQIDSELK